LFLSFTHPRLFSESRINNGEDVTRPLTRFDIRLKVQNGVNNSRGKSVIFTERTDQTWHFERGWTLGFRADTPYEWYYCGHASSCHPEHCKAADRMGDSLFQALLITPRINDRWKFAAGVQFVFPTAGKNLEIGQGKYQILPTFAFSYDLSYWREGDFFGLLVRQAVSYAGHAVPYVNQTYIQPFFNLNLPQGFFLNFAPEMRYNWRIKKWFIPFDIMLGYLWKKKIVISIEYENAIVDDYHRFSQDCEFRVGYFF
jgi:hypothetical protein